MDAREDGVYITYVPTDGADAVTKKLGGEIVKLNTNRLSSRYPTTLNVADKIADYKLLTIDNFCLKNVSVAYAKDVQISATSADKRIIDNYNPSTGVLSLAQSGSYGAGSDGGYDFYAMYDIYVHS